MMLRMFLFVSISRSSRLTHELHVRIFIQYQSVKRLGVKISTCCRSRLSMLNVKILNTFLPLTPLADHPSGQAPNRSILYARLRKCPKPNVPIPSSLGTASLSSGCCSCAC